MGTFAGHVIPGVAFILLGLWHTVSTVFSYKTSIASHEIFQSRIWYPIHCFKHMELLSILGFSILAIASDIIDYHSFHLSLSLLGSEHIVIFLHIIMYAFFALVFDLVIDKELGLIHPLLGLLASSAFGQELFIFHFHSADHVGLEGHYHWLLQLIIFISLVSTLGSTAVPSSFMAAIVRSVSLLFQGLWFVAMGFVLWGPGTGAYSDLGVNNDHESLAHGSAVALNRAQSLANLQFSLILAGIWVFVGFLSLKFLRTVCMDYRRINEERTKHSQNDGAV